jgi:hypothetical protein
MSWKLPDLKNLKDLKHSVENYLSANNFDQYIKQARKVYDQGLKDISSLVHASEIQKIKARVEKEIKLLEVSIDKAINKDMTLLKKYWQEKKKEIIELKKSLAQTSKTKIQSAKKKTKVQVKKVQRSALKKKVRSQSNTNA